MKAKEVLALRLCVMHNLYFYNELTEKIRASLQNNMFDEFYSENIGVLDKRRTD